MGRVAEGEVVGGEFLARDDVRAYGGEMEERDLGGRWRRDDRGGGDLVEDFGACGGMLVGVSGAFELGMEPSLTSKMLKKMALIMLRAVANAIAAEAREWCDYMVVV